MKTELLSCNLGFASAYGRPLDLDDNFRGEAHRPPSYGGQNNLAFHAALVTDVIGPREALPSQAPGLNPDLDLMAFGPTQPPTGVVHWWALSSRAVTVMLHRLGFTETTLTRHTDLPLFTVVGHRPR